MKVAAIIPACLKSTRFPNKILLPIHGLSMIEHVRRRALMCSALSEVIVATCDEEIADEVRANARVQEAYLGSPEEQAAGH